MINLVRSENTALKQPGRVGEKLDKAGATASFLCAIHCAVMPLLITMMPLLGLSFLASEPMEWALFACSAALGTLSLYLGYRQHRYRPVFAVLGLALLFLVMGRLLEEYAEGLLGTLSMVAGGFTMMTVHLINRRLCYSCHICNEESCRQ